MARKAEVIFVGDAASVVRAAKQADAATSKAASSITKSHVSIAHSFTGLAKNALAAGVGFAGAYASIEGVKKSVDAVEALTVATLRLTRTTGLNVKTASAFGAVAEVNGISAQKMGMAFGTLAKNVHAVEDAAAKQQVKIDSLGHSHKDVTEKAKILAAGLGKQAAAFQLLGIPVSQLIKDHGNMNLVMQQTTNAFSKMKPGIDKTAVAMTIFGRGWQTLVPLMHAGDAGLQAQLKTAKEMGATLGGKTVKSLEQLEVAQRNAKYATLGMQLAIGEYLAPAITKVLVGIAGFVRGMRDGTGAGGQFAAVIKTVGTVVQTEFAIISGAVRTVRAAISDWLNTNRAQINQFITAVKNFANDVRTVLTPVFEFMLGVVKRVFPAIKMIVSGVLSSINGYIKIFTGIFTGDWKKAWNGVKQVFSGGVQGILGIVRGITAPIQEASARIGHAIADGLKATLHVVVGVAKNIMTAAVGVVKDTFNALYNMGKYIVQGLIGGIESLAGKVLHTIKSVVMSPVNAVKGLLGINSPSTVFHDMGVNMMQGLSNGVNSAGKLVNNALDKNVTSPIQDAMSGGVKVVGQGMRQIIATTNSALASMNQKPLSPIQVGAMTLGVGKQRQLQGHAGGGLMQVGRAGDAGRDTVPLNVGGTPIAVAPGEQVAVFNRHQLPIVNSALGGIGGLAGLFSKVKTPHYMASGGSLSYGQLEGLWDSAGGPRGIAPLMAAIAEAESTGNPNARNPSGASGLWQILGLPFPGNPMDPLTNARMAVSKYKSQGLGAWVTYSDGSYKRYLKGGVSPMGGAGFAQIAAPAVKGSGVMATIAKAVLGKAAAGANAYLGTFGGAGGFGGGATSGPGGLATFEGVTMAKWIANELSWATKHGWHGQPTSGYRPGFDPHAPGGSEHALISYPGGAVDFGGMTGDPAAYATKLALVTLAARLNYPGPRLKMPIGFRDDGHLSGSGHAKGGFVGSYKDGGIAPRDGFAYVHKGEAMIPAYATGGGLGGRLTNVTPYGVPSTPNLAGIVGSIMHSGLLYPIDAAITALSALAAQAKNPIKINLQIAGLNQLKAFKDAIVGLRSQAQGLAQQAAQAWNALRTGNINATHDAAIAAINGGSDATTLAAMQKQDTVAANAAQLAGLQDTLGTDQFLAAHSGGQTHLNALQQVKADQAAIDAFYRQQTEQQLQDNITTATQKADDAQTIALNSLTQQTVDYQNGLDAQFGALTNSLNARKITYATWAADVNAILASYGLSVATDPSTEGAVSAGPGAAAVRVAAKKPTLQATIAKGHPSWWGGHRAGGGSVRPGYVYRVGEQGPEDVMFGRPGTVMTAAQSRGGGPTVHIAQANFTGTRAARAFADRLAYRAAIGVA